MDKDYEAFLHSLYITRTRTKGLTVNGLKSKSGTEIDMSFVKTKTNTDSYRLIHSLYTSDPLIHTMGN